MDLKNMTITKGVALVLAGPQGCGKTTLAEHIAKKHGSFAHIEALELKHRNLLDDTLFIEPDTVIVEGFPGDNASLSNVKEILTADKVTLWPKHRNPLSVKAPNFIFCTSDPDPIPLISQDRRFFVVRMDN